MSEFRQDLVSGEWVITAPERMKRPHDAEKRVPREASPKRGCPFEDLKKSGNWPPLISYPNEANWSAVVLPNKYPALIHDSLRIKIEREGIYNVVPGVGAHDIILTKGHHDKFESLSLSQALLVFELIQERYRMLENDPCVVYASAIHNWGAGAGASVYHPHYQIISIPIIPNFIVHSLEGSKRYFRQHRRCAHCDILRFERKEKVRIIEENSEAAAIAPFASLRPYEIKIFPKAHHSHIEDTPEKALKGSVAILQSVLKRLRVALGDPDFNFYVHSGPLKDKRLHRNYHWHIEIIPVIYPPPGGFELGTGIEINSVGPENAAEIFRGIRARQLHQRR